jgi:outer membrane receptor for ferrienterochelin and colicins
MRTAGCPSRLRAALMLGSAIAISVAAAPTPAADPEFESLLDLDLEGLLAVDISSSLATGLPLPQRRNPAILSILTAEDLRAMGARDLIDVINRVPGFNIAKDIDDAGLLVRGLYAFEGRALLLLDGLPLNDLAFGAYPLGNDIPIHLLERIEIIRGPGSVRYGGTAETAVINLVTHNDGGEASLRAGALPSAPGHYDAGLRLAEQHGDWHGKALVFAGGGRRSDADYRFFDQRPAFRHNAASAGIVSHTVAAELGWAQRWVGKVLWQHYENAIVRGFALDPALPPAARDAALAQGIAANSSPLRWDNLVLAVHGRLYQGERWHGEIELSVQDNLPFERPRRDDLGIRRYKLANSHVWQRGDQQWLLGIEALSDHARIVRTGEPELRDPSLALRAAPDAPAATRVRFDSAAAFVNWQRQWNHLGAFAGARFDYHEAYASQLSPRLGLTWVGQRWHAKLLSHQAFRAPLLANTAFSRFGYEPSRPHRRRVGAETTVVHELELGYRITPQWFISGNLFHQTVDDIIEFRYNPVADDLYSDNGGRMGSYGFELETRYQAEPWRLVGNLSHAWPRLYDHDNPFAYASRPRGGDTYLALHRPDEWLGVPGWKLFANAEYRVAEGQHLFLNLLWLSRKNAATEQPFGVTGDLPAQTLVDVGWRRDLGTWSLTLSVHDLGNQRLNVVTPYYDSGFDTLPYKGREFSVDLRLRF